MKNIKEFKSELIITKTDMTSILKGVVLLIIGIAIFFLPEVKKSGVIPSCLIFTGVMLICVAIYFFAAKFRKNVYAKTGSRIVKESIFYRNDDFEALKAGIENRDAKSVANVQKQTEANVMVDMLYSKDYQYLALQLKRYEPFEFKPQTDVIEIEGELVYDMIKSLVL